MTALLLKLIWVRTKILNNLLQALYHQGARTSNGAKRGGAWKAGPDLWFGGAGTEGGGEGGVKWSA